MGTQIFRPISLKSLEDYIEYESLFRYDDRSEQLESDAKLAFTQELIQSDTGNGLVEQDEFLQAVNKFTSSQISSLDNLKNIKSSTLEWQAVKSRSIGFGIIDEYTITKSETDVSSSLELLNIGEEWHDPNIMNHIF